MNIMELFDPAPEGYHDEKQDGSVLHKDESRKNVITIAHLHQMRISHDAKKIEFEKKLKKIAKQYAPPMEPGMGGGLGGLGGGLGGF